MGIACDRPVYFPLHRYLDLPGYPATEEAWRNSISIPIYPGLTDEEVDRVADGVTACRKEFC
jgi:dTDP-4-amino-4,6-dideoxygalactose transaminase